MAARFGGMWSCYRTRLRRLPVLGGRLELRFEVSEAGTIGALRIASSELRDDLLIGCLRSTLNGLSLPSSEQGTTSVVYPLLLVPGVEDAAERPARSTRRHEIGPACSRCTAGTRGK
jgi:hypothetical protein